MESLEDILDEVIEEEEHLPPTRFVQTVTYIGHLVREAVNLMCRLAEPTPLPESSTNVSSSEPMAEEPSISPIRQFLMILASQLWTFAIHVYTKISDIDSEQYAEWASKAADILTGILEDLQFIYSKLPGATDVFDYLRGSWILLGEESADWMLHFSTFYDRSWQLVWIWQDIIRQQLHQAASPLKNFYQYASPQVTAAITRAKPIVLTSYEWCSHEIARLVSKRNLKQFKQRIHSTWLEILYFGRFIVRIHQIHSLMWYDFICRLAQTSISGATSVAGYTIWWLTAVATTAVCFGHIMRSSILNPVTEMVVDTKQTIQRRLCTTSIILPISNIPVWETTNNL